MSIFSKTKDLKLSNKAQITIIHPDGEINYADIPEGGKDLLLVLQETVGGYIEVIPFISTGKYMVVNEMAKLSPHEINRVATAISRKRDSSDGSRTTPCNESSAFEKK